ncbi:hypothetical protein M2408_004097 [Sphingobacterium sp. BIGb0165]|nr:hypothetical protein [Sphingobacterium sp. BIGb0165]
MPSQPSQDKTRINRNIKSTNTDQAYKYFYRRNRGIYSRRCPAPIFVGISDLTACSAESLPTQIMSGEKMQYFL